MKLSKSEINLFFNIYIGIILFCLIISTVISVSHIIFLFLFFIPFIFFIFKFSSLKISSELFIYVTLIAGAIFFTFRFFRSLFNIPKINEDKIIGYAQYFGYPFHFDTLLFFIFIMIPALMTLYIKFKKK